MVSLGQKLKVEEDDCGECTPHCGKQSYDTDFDFYLSTFCFQVAITSVLLSTKILEMKWEARSRGRRGGNSSPTEICRFEFNSATKVEFCLLNWTAVNGSSSFQVLSAIVTETNCRIAHILGILLMNSCNTDIFFSNYYHLQSVRFEW